MPADFLVSDQHFGHANILKFKRADGSLLRPGFNSVEEMDEFMVKAHNERVSPNDKCYFLGDVVIPRRKLEIIKRLNGDKVLIRGNHDIFKTSEYTEYFRDVRAYHVMNGMILSHIPLHPASLGRFGTNIHGHTHEKRVMKRKWFRNVVDVRYHSVCVEQNVDFAPILFEDVIKRIKAEGGKVGFRNGNGPTS